MQLIVTYLYKIIKIYILHNMQSIHLQIFFRMLHPALQIKDIQVQNVRFKKMWNKLLSKSLCQVLTDSRN